MSLLALVSLVGCASSQFDGQVYRADDVAFRVGALPPGFRQIESDEARISLQNDADGATAAVSARCGLDSDDVPLRALVRHLFIQFEDRTILREEEFELDGRKALETELTASLDGVMRHFVVVVVKKDGCVYDFMHIDGGNASASRVAFSEMVRGFSTLD